MVFGCFQQRSYLRLRNGGEVLKKIGERMSSFKVIKKRANGNARASKAGRAAHHFRINRNYGRFHGCNLFPLEKTAKKKSQWRAMKIGFWIRPDQTVRAIAQNPHIC